jgi:hypothetical protein
VTAVKTTKTGFKVVRSHRESLTVFRPATVIDDITATRYRLLETTTQNENRQGPFAVFESLSQARDFADLFRHWLPTILFVEYEPSLAPVLHLWHYTYDDAIVPNGYKKVEHYGLCPPGTDFAKKVTPLFVVNKYDPDELDLVNLKEPA